MQQRPTDELSVWNSNRKYMWQPPSSEDEVRFLEQSYCICKAGGLVFCCWFFFFFLSPVKSREAEYDHHGWFDKNIRQVSRNSFVTSQQNYMSWKMTSAGVCNSCKKHLQPNCTSDARAAVWLISVLLQNWMSVHWLNLSAQKPWWNSSILI